MESCDSNRSKFFEQSLDTLNKSVSYEALQDACKELETSIATSYPSLPFVDVTQLCHLKQDQYSKSLIPSDLQKDNMVPLMCSGDGNCLYRAVSLRLCGNEYMHLELRVRTICELTCHKQYYLRPEAVSLLDASGYITRRNILPQLSANFERATGSDREMVANLCLEIDCMESTRLKTYSNMWHVHALSSVTQSSIRSVYPDCNSYIRPVLNKVVQPRTGNPHDRSMTIMWTRTCDMARPGWWSPNHFVLCVPIPLQPQLQTLQLSSTQAHCSASSPPSHSVPKSLQLHSSPKSIYSQCSTRLIPFHSRQKSLPPQSRASSLPTHTSSKSTPPQSSPKLLPPHSRQKSLSSQCTPKPIPSHSSQPHSPHSLLSHGSQKSLLPRNRASSLMSPPSQKLLQPLSSQQSLSCQCSSNPIPSHSSQPHSPSLLLSHSSPKSLSSPASPKLQSSPKLLPIHSSLKSPSSQCSPKSIPSQSRQPHSPSPLQSLGSQKSLPSQSRASSLSPPKPKVAPT